MGFSFGNVAHLLNCKNAIRKGARVLDFGSQNIHGDIPNSLAREFVNAFSQFPISEKDLSEFTRHGAKAGPFLSAMGFRYTAIDMYSEGNTRKLDLNVDRLPWLWRGRFDVVMNSGTTEHVANQYNAFKVAHDALRVGGIMFNGVPFYGNIDHGLVNYHPKFFTSLIDNNQYEPLYFGFTDVFDGGDTNCYRNLSTADNGVWLEGCHVGCALLFVNWRKRRNLAFRPPTDFVLKGGTQIPPPSVDGIVASIPKILD